ncbi:hypothetical protein nbrc107696_23070 [Gordonia spumicola]|uniref:EccD-like transmembrane domain-containing protein n=1 Tax=Gordonia spumicola TaxID=589161 RepID=A0A7I9V9T7_9ACTN|nr:type VII secretion integral membrane protein EccD [Gordonia spumicola]GEE01861.1 hypothetical protein nbrc107696_23070 [Gordonia spumicola]
MTVATGSVRISVVGGRTQVDLAVPASMPLTSLMPDVLALLRVDEAPREAPGTAAACWTLARIGGDVLSPSESLRDNDVHDGDLLILTDDPPAVPRPTVDDVVAGVAALTADTRSPWTAMSARWTAYGVAVVAACASSTAGAVAAIRGDSTPTLIAGVAAAVLLVAALVGDRLGSDPRTSATFSMAASVFAAAAGFTFGTSGGSRLALAGIAAATVAVIGCRGTGTLLAAHTAIATTGLTAAAVGVVDARWSMPLVSVAAIGAALGVGVLMVAARVAIAAARLPLPPVPASPPPIGDVGSQRSTVDGVDALGPERDDPLGAIADLALGDLDSLAARSAAASSYLTGMVAGATVTTATCTVVAATADPTRVVVVFCAVVAMTLLARGRVHADRIQSATLIAGGASCAIAAPLAVALVADDAASAVTAMITALVVGAAALVAGTVAAHHEFSPLHVRAAEIGHYLVLASMLPLLLWVLDAYRLVREL